MFRNNLLRKNTVGESGAPSLLQKEKDRSAKFDVSKVLLFPGIENITNQKKRCFLLGNKLLAGDFVLIWMKQTLIWFNLQRDRTRDGLPNIKETFSESLQLQMSVLHQRMSIFQSSRLVSQFHMMAGKNV